MKLFFIRYSKILFTYLQLHRVFQFFNGLYLNLYFMSRFSRWAAANRKISFNDFPSKWDYQKRYNLYKYIIEKEGLAESSFLYLEFGVANGESIRWFSRQNLHPDSRFFGFDTFTGLPEDFGVYKKGTFNSQHAVPQIDDPRVSFYQGLFQQTLPGFLPGLHPTARKVIMMDADLYSATLYTLTCLAPLLKSGDLIFFDEFSVPTHEFRAYEEFVQTYYINLELLAATNNYYFVAFKVK